MMHRDRQVAAFVVAPEPPDGAVSVGRRRGWFGGPTAWLAFWGGLMVRRKSKMVTSIGYQFTRCSVVFLLEVIFISRPLQTDRTIA